MQDVGKNDLAAALAGPLAAHVVSGAVEGDFAFCGAGDKTCGALAALGAMHSALPDWLGATGLDGL